MVKEATADYLYLSLAGSSIPRKEALHQADYSAEIKQCKEGRRNARFNLKPSCFATASAMVVNGKFFGEDRWNVLVCLVATVFATSSAVQWLRASKSVAVAIKSTGRHSCADFVSKKACM